ncbi:Allantoinase [Actinosynnema pretiosum subsp. pretiosum]|nr:Allantoinase [Actinosynnema pretiosum subsp. pretiosum]
MRHFGRAALGPRANHTTGSPDTPGRSYRPRSPDAVPEARTPPAANRETAAPQPSPALRAAGTLTRMDLVFRAKRVITPDGEIGADVGVADGRITVVVPHPDPTGPGRAGTDPLPTGPFRTSQFGAGPFDAGAAPTGPLPGLAATGPFPADPAATPAADLIREALRAGAELVELPDDEVLIPGLVDTHVHVNDPGRADWEGFPTATLAAAAGGVTSIVDMPLNSLPPTTTPAALDAKLDAARGRVHVDVGFWGGLLPGNGDQLAALVDRGVFGFKCFLAHSGVDEFPHVDVPRLRAALTRLPPDLPVIVHAEDPAHLAEPASGDYPGFLASRPHAAEQRAVADVIAAARDTGHRLHVLHVSSARAAADLAAAKRDGVPVTAETCPHYLTFTAEEIPEGATAFKCCPPIREAANRELLWAALRDGALDLVVSDHSPCTPDLKRGDFATAWGGVASLQLGLPAVWTQARRRGFALTDVVRWMSTAPADLTGLRHKGRIAPGADADLCAFAPDAAFVVDRAHLRHRNPVTAYHGLPLAGEVRRTWLRGRRITGDAPSGRFLTRGGGAA